MKYWITGNSCWFCRITVIEECKYVSRGTRGYTRKADRWSKEPRCGGEKLSKRNDARQARAKRTRVSSHAPPYVQPISVSMYVHTHVLRTMATLLRVHDHRSTIKLYAPVNVSLYVRYFGFVHHDTSENDGFGWRAGIYYTAYSRNANNGRNCTKKRRISPLGWIQSVVAPFKAHFHSPLCLTTFVSHWKKF